MELFELPRQRRNLGSCHVVLASLLDGEFEVVSDCECHGGEGTEDKSDKKEDDGKADGGEKKKGGKGQSLSSFCFSFSHRLYNIYSSLYTCDIQCNVLCDFASQTRLIVPQTDELFAEHRVDWIIKLSRRVDV